MEGVKVIRRALERIGMVKTTIDIPEELWKKFSIKVIQEHGGRKKNDVIEELLKKYVADK
jgi:metal-responsive CopG/Arc/MetJ family transcriptional regulator